MILNDQQLWSECQLGMVSPFLSGNLQGSSVDLTLGTEIKVESQAGDPILWNSKRMGAEGHFIRPGEFLLAHTAETVRIPDNYAAMLLLRSSAARAGFEHSFSGWCDPGFDGQLTLELRNNLQYRSLLIKPGMRICQLVVFRLTSPAHSSYGERGHYQHQKGATASCNSFNKEAL